MGMFGVGLRTLAQQGLLPLCMGVSVGVAWAAPLCRAPTT